MSSTNNNTEMEKLSSSIQRPTTIKKRKIKIKVKKTKKPNKKGKEIPNKLNKVIKNEKITSSTPSSTPSIKLIDIKLDNVYDEEGKVF